jgi:hypothetical protein
MKVDDVGLTGVSDVDSLVDGMVEVIWTLE